MVIESYFVDEIRTIIVTFNPPPVGMVIESLGVLADWENPYLFQPTPSWDGH